MKFVAGLFLIQTVIILLYTQVGYNDETGLLVDGTNTTSTHLLSKVTNAYGVWMDVHVMIFIGFGYLMTFLAQHGFGSVGFNLMVAALAMEWSMVVVPVVHSVMQGHAPFKHLTIDTVMLIEGDFGAAAVLISFGGLLGKVGPLQLVIVALIEIVIYAINFNVVAVEIGTLDVGGSLVIHAFGAYFGLACSWVVTKRRAFDHPKNTSNRTSDLFAMIGTAFLWVYWPSFVSALVPHNREMCALHTVLALCGSCVCGFLASMRLAGKFDMVHIQNATLAGGVAIGTCADMDISPCGAMAIGCFAGVWSTVGYVKISPYLEAKIGLHDTCGIHNLHGMPGLLGGIASIIAIALGRGHVLGVAQEDIAKQTWKQFWGLLVSLIFALFGGLCTGYLISEPIFDQPEDDFEDACFWEMPGVDESDEAPAEAPSPSAVKIAIPIFIVQAAMLIVYAPKITDVGYWFRDTGSSAWDMSIDMVPALGGDVNIKTVSSYGVWMDVHVMIFIGFGFLMTFLYRHGFGSVAFNLMIAALVMQWSMVVVPAVHNLFKHHSVFQDIKLDTVMLIEGDFAAAAVLITFGGLLGKVGPVQLIIVGLCEVVVYAINFNVVAGEIGALDVGGSLVIHAFGAYFGLAASLVLTRPSQMDPEAGGSKNRSSYTSDMFAMVGTAFLWIYWPSFVSALVPYGRERCAIHTVLALCGSCVCAFATSKLLSHKLDMVHIQNATLAGGVAIGTLADFEIGMWGALLVGCVAGIWSVFGYQKISPILEKCGIHDTCGIHNLHGMPGVIAGVGSIFAVLNGDAALLGIADSDKGSQATKQLLGLVVTLAFAIAGGLLVGFLAKLYGEADFVAYEDSFLWTIEYCPTPNSSGFVPAKNLSQVCPCSPQIPPVEEPCSPQIHPASPVPIQRQVPGSQGRVPTPELVEEPCSPQIHPPPVLIQRQAPCSPGRVVTPEVAPALLPSPSSPDHAEHPPSRHRAFVACAALTQLVILVFYLFFAKYADIDMTPGTGAASDRLDTVAVTENYYGVFMDIHVMIFVGFGFLMTFLKNHGFGSVGFNFLVAALAMEWCMIVMPMMHNGFAGAGHSLFDMVPLDSAMLIEGDFGAAAVLITFGALLGKVGPLHLLIIALVEIIIYAVNFQCVAKIGTLDVGGSLVIHAFGAYFGLAASFVLTPSEAHKHPKNSSSYNTDIFAMLGTVFLWIYWPSFVTALIPEAREVGALHTVLALCGSTMVTFAASYFFEGRFDMVHIQNATLAGGVAIGAVADMDLLPFGAICVGCVAGFLSTFGYVKIAPILEAVGVHDTCGVHNLHGMPGLIGGFSSIIAVAAGAAKFNHEGVSTGTQAGKQVLGMLVTGCFAIGGGLLTGLLCKIACPPLEELFEDTEFWEVNQGRLVPTSNNNEKGQYEKDHSPTPIRAFCEVKPDDRPAFAAPIA